LNEKILSLEISSSISDMKTEELRESHRTTPPLSFIAVDFNDDNIREEPNPTIMEFEF
jgi:hypothetical protein